MSTNTVTRRYALKKKQPGVYLLLSNDDRVMWRLMQYKEDGSAEYVDMRGKRRQLWGRFWALDYVSMDAFVKAAGEYFGLEYLEWRSWEFGLPTRRAAITRALESDPLTRRKDPAR